MADLARQLTNLSAEVKRLSYEHEVDAKRIRSHEVRINRLRLDKQLSGFPRWIANRFRGGDGEVEKDLQENPASRGRLLVLAPKYPTDESPYGGQPIERRLRFYRDAGYSSTVFVPAPTISEEVRDGIQVSRGPVGVMEEVLEAVRPTHLVVHHPIPELWEAVRPLLGRLPVLLWIHGFEARNWKDLHYNFTEQELQEKAAWLDALNIERQKALQEAFPDKRIHKVFVSEYMKSVAEDFVGVKAVNSTVIHNVIDTGLFQYRERGPDERFRILSVRSFASRNYATDLTSRVIERLARGPFSDQIDISLYGDGKHFEADTEGLRGLPNVSITRKILDGPEMAQVMDRYGVMLLPTRWDSQGMTMGEAMATGMVVITNRIAAIPEFIDDQTGMLSDPEDVDGMVESVHRLCSEPDLFLSISKTAATRVRMQCGPGATIDNEISLFEATAAL